MAEPTSSFEDIHELDLSLLPETVARFYSQIIQWGYTAPATVNEAYHKLGSQGRVRSMIADSPELNAWATSHEDGFVIGLFAAAPIILHFTCNQLLRCPMVFPSVGQPQNEAPETNGYTHGVPLTLPDTLPVQEACTVLPSVSRPEDDERAAAASALTELASAFAMFHEVSHVIAGHAGYLRSSQNLALFELTRRPIRRSHSRLLRVWEYEADKIAAVMLLSFLVAPENQDHFADVFSISAKDSEHLVAQLTAAGISAAYILFLLLGQRSAALRAGSVHPHPLVV
ncbi:MAG: hypothetical protein KC996_00825 [Phycisphaerales bacterium]|nr:hypothetical protein [Phycisphaerales bacterium]